MEGGGRRSAELGEGRVGGVACHFEFPGSTGLMSMKLYRRDVKLITQKLMRHDVSPVDAEVIVDGIAYQALE